ncbi:MAG: hypothetical protein ACP5VF_04765 [Acidobacteriota bacterium]
MSNRRFLGTLLTIPFLLALAVQAAPPRASGSWVIPARALEEHAEDSIDLLMASKPNTAKLEAMTAQMEALLRRLQMASLGRAEVTRQASQAESALGQMKAEIASRAYVKAALAANQITMVMLPIEGFPTPEHREVALLDCLSREITLLNEDEPASHAPLLKERRDQIEATWKLLRPWYAARKGTAKLMADVDACVASIRSDTEAAQQVKAGNRLGDLVDELERYRP